jgi:transposase
VTTNNSGGRPLKYGHRLVIDTILYVLVSGCAWRLAPHDLAPWDAAYRWFRSWSAAGVWDDIHTALRDAVRRAEGRDPAPTAAVLDSQTAKSASGGEQIGYDAGKRTRGRKRHLLVISPSVSACPCNAARTLAQVPSRCQRRYSPYTDRQCP